MTSVKIEKCDLRSKSIEMIVVINIVLKKSILFVKL